VLVGFYLPSDKIIIFDLSDKLYSILKSPLGAISNSEGIRKIASQSKLEIMTYWNKLLKIQFSLIVCLGLITYLISHFSLIYKGINIVEIFYCLAGLSISMPFVAMSNTFGVLFTPVFGGINTFNLSMLIGGIVFVLLSFVFIKLKIFSLLTLIIILFIVEACIGIACLFNSRKFLYEI
jgi:hypothetical protein